MAGAILEVRDLSKYYINGQNVVTGLNRVNLTFRRGEFVAITGESGSGKSTLAHILSGVLPYEDGELYVDGKPTSHYDSADWEAYRRDQVAFISQSYGILPGATVADNVVSALRLAGMDKAQAREKARAILEEVELWPFRRRRAAKLSSGQKQRLSIARALAKPCPILIADEPTGNLDPENSEKVIRLLTKAAGERLVILITHEFSEAEDRVTRHISMHNGVICSDAQLRPAAEPAPVVPREPAPQKLGGSIAWLQLKARPVWSAMVLLFFTLTAFAVFAFLGSFIVALDDTTTRIYQSDAFLNGAMDRIVAVRKDGGTFTQEDYDTILSIKYVDRLERFGYAADMLYAYREGTDYSRGYTNVNYGNRLDPLYVTVESVQIYQSAPFVQTVPLVSGEFLTAGRLPENFYEIVAVGDKALLGQEITVYLRNAESWNSGSYIKLNATVTGVTDQGSGLYFHEDVGRMLTVDYLQNHGLILRNPYLTYIPWYEQVSSEYIYTDYISSDSNTLALIESEPAEGSVLRELEENEALVSPYIRFNYNYTGSDYATMYQNGVIIDSWIGDDGYQTFSRLNIAGLLDSTHRDLIAVTESRFDAWIEANLDGCGDQVSLTIRDYAYTQRVISQLEEKGYYALSPFVLGSATVDEALAAQRTKTLWVCLGALAVVILLQLIVLRALFGMENESYRILSNIGLTYRTARSSLLWQVLAFTALGQLLGISGILLCGHLGVERIVNLTKYLYGPYWAVLSLVHLAASLTAGAGIIRTMKNQIYPLSARRSDLSLDEISGEVSL